MRRWHYIAILLAAVPVAAWSFWGPGGMADGKVGPGVTVWTDPVTDYDWYIDYNETNSVGFVDGSGNNLTATNKPTALDPTQEIGHTNQNGRVEYNCSYDGSDDYSINTTLVAARRTNIVMGGWFKWQGANGNNQILSFIGNDAANGWGIYLPSGAENVTILCAGIGTVDLGWQLPSNTWIHLMIQKDGFDSNWGWSTNGIALVNTGVHAPDPATPSGGATGLAADQSGNGDFNGSIDEFFVGRATTITATVNSNHFYNTPPIRNFPGANAGGNIRVRTNP
jgi:hypothetical protein